MSIERDSAPAHRPIDDGAARGMPAPVEAPRVDAPVGVRLEHAPDAEGRRCAPSTAVLSVVLESLALLADRISELDDAQQAMRLADLVATVGRLAALRTVPGAALHEALRERLCLEPPYEVPCGCLVVVAEVLDTMPRPLEHFAVVDSLAHIMAQLTHDQAPVIDVRCLSGETRFTVKLPYLTADQDRRVHAMLRSLGCAMVPCLRSHRSVQGSTSDHYRELTILLDHASTANDHHRGR